MLTSKLLSNSILSMPYTKLMGIDINNFYLNTPMGHYEYTRIPIYITLQEIVDGYQLTNKVKNGFIMCEI